MKLMKWWDELDRRERGNGNLNASGRARLRESGPSAGSWARTTWGCRWPIPTTVRVVTDWGRTARTATWAPNRRSWLVAVERMRALDNEASAQPAELMAGGAGGVGPGLGRTRVTRLGARSRPAGRPRCG